MDLLQLRYFQIVAHLEHMTNAAKQLKVAQPSLSQTISRLEEELGFSLFDREGRNIKLNSFGKILLKRVDRAFSELESAKVEMAELAGESNNLISLSVMHTPLLPNIISKFRKAYPSAKFQVSMHSPLRLVDQLEKGEIDVCVTYFPIEKEGINWVNLMEDEVFIVVPEKHPLAERKCIRLREVEDEQFINMERTNPFRMLTDRFCEKAGFTPNIAFELEEPGSIHSYVEAGLGISFLTEHTIRYASHEKIVPLHIEQPVCKRTIGMAWKSDRYTSKVVREFREFMIRYFKELE
ncbi:LysR family transcriptional regulator [Bacillus sp. FJAT-49736]|uniref:LysR family transcriptional regulator n=1 Tax=Bacillus sp. FJAT-49736 TaxID=2833582 RepID=UPI001BC98092|nr:LysR family transcriptional regulator [Bacillus sp. FJAT-49736]MBS4174653.1 LysR family transcriptional regulator [Bacillus sp. FJAT-49736]